MFKNLEWQTIENRSGNNYVAYSPAAIYPNKVSNGIFIISQEQDLYWASWDLTIPGYGDLEALKALAEQKHQDFFMGWLK